MQKFKGNATLIVIIILSVLLVIAIAFGAYFWGKSKSSTQSLKTASPSPVSTKSSITAVTPKSTPTAISGQTQETAKQVVENFMKYTLGTLPGAQLNDEKARAYLSDTMQAQYVGEGWVARFYGIQDGPTSIKFISENTAEEEVTVRYDPSWGEMSLGWAFILVKDNDKWFINGFRNDTQ